MKIAMIGHKRIPSREGGVEIVVEMLSERLVKKGHKVVCYNRKGKHVSTGKKDKTNTMYSNIKIINVPTLDIKGFAAATANLLATIHVAFSKCDVVHFHAEGSAVMCWLPKLFGKKIIVTIHGLDHQRAKWGKFAKTYIMLGEKNAVKFADEIIVLSNNVKNYFWSEYTRDTNLIPNGVVLPINRSSLLIKEKYGLEKNEYILFLGRIVPEKGLLYLVEAFKKVKTSKKLVIAGGSSDTNLFLKQIKALALNDTRIIFTGFVEGKLLEELYSNAYFYTLPSDLEGMPLSLLEAMSYGNCCLVSNIPECTEVVEDKAVIFEKGNCKDLQMKMQTLCDNIDLVNKYKDTASEYICKKYNWDIITEQTIEIYKG